MSSPRPQRESLQFNPPPNWPAQPPGWTPPPGWVPDPSWPPPPAGWPLWITDAGAAGTLPGAGPGTEARRFQRRRARGIWLGIAAAAVAVVLVGGGLAYFLRPVSQSSYALGKNFEVAASQRDAGLLLGPVSQLAKTCTADLSAAQPGQRPAAAGKAAVQQWVQGCAAGYHQEHPHQLVQDGIMYGAGAKPCTGACQSRSQAAGKSIALSASTLPGLSPAEVSSAPAASNWCADLMLNKFSQRLSASVESRLQANKPAIGPATAFWDQGCEAGYLAGAVTATGAFGAAPDVTIPARQAASSIYVKTLIQGTGTTLTSSDGLIADYVAYDWSGKTSKLLGSSYSPGLFLQGQMLNGLEAALFGQKVGSRVVAVIPPADGLGSKGAPEGVGANDTLVFVVDMISTFATESVPGTQTSDGGGALPTVTPPAPNSTAGPTITIPANVAAPDTLQVKTLIKGTGPVVAQGQDIAVQYSGYIWRTGKAFQSSWTDGQGPFMTPIGVGQVIKGWDTGLVGQTAGSRVLLVVPPADGYGSAGSAQAGINGTDTLVFVIDILAAAD
jgi:FKBP-type peptidyl-prolyl cis-trans isomerase